MKIFKPIYGQDNNNYNFNYYNFNYYFYLHSLKYKKVLKQLNIFHYQKNNYFISRNYIDNIDIEEELYLDYNNLYDYENQNYYDLNQNLF